MTIDGECAKQFKSVRELFLRGFNDVSPYGEIGAAVCVYVDGERVIDLWGGAADPNGGGLWSRDTMVNMLSVGKGLAALCVHQLADSGQIDLDRNVAEYWPEFGSAGKQHIRVRHILDHRAGIPYLPRNVTGLSFDLDEVSAAIAAAPPVWPVEQTPCYHSLTMGFVCAKIVLEITGQRIDEVLRAGICDPLEASVYFRLRTEELPRLASIVVPHGSSFLDTIRAEPESIFARTYAPFTHAPIRFSNESAMTESASTCHGEARGVARIYAALSMGGSLGGVRIIGKAALERACQQQWQGTEAMTESGGWRMAYGFLLNSARFRVGPNARAFGHDGAGGAMGYADPDARIGFGYAPNSMSTSVLDNPRAERLIDAVYTCL